MPGMDPVARDKAREEFKRLARSHGGDYPGYLILKRMKDWALQQAVRPANDKSARLYQRELMSIARNGLGGFHFESMRYKPDGAHAAQHVNSFYYWNVVHAIVSGVAEEHDARNESFVSLRHAKISADRKRTVYDDMDAHVVLNQHCLGRMLERGAAWDRPLDVLSGSLSEWYPLAMSMLVLHHFGADEGYTGFLPTPQGAFLTKVSFSRHTLDSQGHNLTRRRVVTDRGSWNFQDAPLYAMLDAELNGEEGFPSLQLSTYISTAQFSTAQWWAHQQLSKIREEHSEFLLNLYPKLIHSTQLVPKLDLLKNQIDSFHGKITKLIDNDRWIQACRIA